MKYLLGAFFLLACVPQVPAEGVKAGRRPNIVVILADDLGAECLGCYGGKSYRTPRLDKLAGEGTRFGHCHATPLCSPSRAELLTGRYCFRTGITRVVNTGPTVNTRLDVQTHRTFANFLREAGYATCIVGKWHLCLDFADNPSHVEAAGFSDRYLWRLLRGKQVVRHYWNPGLWVNDQPADELGRGKFGDDLFTEHVIQFIRTHKDRPFLVYYPMTLVHSQSATGKNYPPSPDTLPGCADPDEQLGSKQKSFTGLVAYMDKLVGRIADEIDRQNLGDNTLLIFAGDNGTDRAIASYLGVRLVPGGKGRLDEAGTRVPLVVRWKGTVPPGRVVEDLVDFTDFFPTILEAAGATKSPAYPIDGRSFLPQLRGEPGQPRSWVYRHLHKNWFIRDTHFRLDSTGQFWDISADPYAPQLADTSAPAAAARQRLAEAVKTLKAAR